jgi:hypothetical protein
VGTKFVSPWSKKIVIGQKKLHNFSPHLKNKKWDVKFVNPWAKKSHVWVNFFYMYIFFLNPW